MIKKISFLATPRIADKEEVVFDYEQDCIDFCKENDYEWKRITHYPSDSKARTFLKDFLPNEKWDKKENLPEWNLIEKLMEKFADDQWHFTFKILDKIQKQPISGISGLLLSKNFDITKTKIVGNRLLMYEDDLPKGISEDDYSAWFDRSEVVEGVRMGDIYISK